MGLAALLGFKAQREIICVISKLYQVRVDLKRTLAVEKLYRVGPGMNPYGSTPMPGIDKFSFKTDEKVSACLAIRLSNSCCIHL